MLILIQVFISLRFYLRFECARTSGRPLIAGPTKITRHTKIPLLVDRNKINCVINGITTTCTPHNSVGASKIYRMNELNFIFVLATCPACVCVCVCVFVPLGFYSMTIPMRILHTLDGPECALVPFMHRCEHSNETITNDDDEHWDAGTLSAMRLLLHAGYAIQSL